MGMPHKKYREYNYIYCIKNKINDKRYIGRSFDPENRIKMHLVTLRNGLGYKKMQNDFDKFGEENFFTEILEVHRVDDCKPEIREDYWILYYQSNKNGYNTRLSKYSSPSKKIVSGSILTEDYQKMMDILAERNISQSMWLKEIIRKELNEIEKNKNTTNQY